MVVINILEEEMTRTERANKRRKTRKIIIPVLLIIVLILGAVMGLMLKKEAAKKEEEARLAATPPVIELSGGDTVEMLFGDEYKEAGFTAVDAYGEDISASVETKIPEIDQSGEYTIKYTVEDRNGNTADASRKLKVSFPPQTSEGKKRGLSVLMYHKVYDPAKPPKNGVDANCIKAAVLEEELKYLVDEGYYFPTWKEVRQYLDGEIDLPEKSVCLTFDDGTTLFEENGVPLIEKYDVRATAFIIGTKRGKHWSETDYKHLWLESHSYDMHRPGGNIGHGGVFTALSYEDALADLNKSIKLLGSGDAFAYPFGDYDDECLKVVEDAGFLCAFTTEYGKIHPGDNPVKLTRVRVQGSPSLSQFKSLL